MKQVKAPEVSLAEKGQQQNQEENGHLSVSAGVDLKGYGKALIIVLLLLALFYILQQSYCYQPMTFFENENTMYDVIIFGATPAGFAAALAAKASGVQSVLLLEPTTHVGGMASAGGIGLRDCDHNDIRINNSTQYAWAMRNAEFYGIEDPVWQPDNWVGELMFLEMLREYGVELRLNTTFVEGKEGILTTVDSAGLRRISAIKLESGELVKGKYFIDASYEGEVMMASGHVSYIIGRENRTRYGESLAGISEGSIGQFQYPIYLDSFPENRIVASLMKWVQSDSDPRNRSGEADRNVMAYTFRPCLTSEESNMVPFTEPPGYDPADFELSRQNLIAEMEANADPLRPWNNLGYHGYPYNKEMKWDACCGLAAIGIDAVGLAVEYPNATRAKRKEIYEKHKYYVQGLMWFWANDPIVPEDIQNEFRSLGLCKDEWPDNDHFPPQLYVREAARIIGDRVFTQNDRIETTNDSLVGCFRDSIAIGSWGLYIHEMERVVVREESTSRRIIYNEGLTSPENGGVYFFEIPYSILLPKRKEMVNLAVPNCPSTSHVAFSAIHEEPTLWQLGQAAGTAAGIALEDGYNVPLQDINHKELQAAMIEQGTFVHWPPTRKNCE